MRDLVLLAIHLVVTLAKLLRADGIRAVIAESLLLKHQILISNRSRQRAPLCSAIIGSRVLRRSPDKRLRARRRRDEEVFVMQAAQDRSGKHECPRRQSMPGF